MKKDNSKKPGIHLNKYLSQAGVCSRRKAVELIEAGSVTVNGKKVTQPWHGVQPNDTVRVKRKKIAHTTKQVYLVLNKPDDCITTVFDERGRKTVMDYLKPKIKQRVYPIGRLDRKTTGVLLFTNDGALTQKLVHPRYGVQKEYHVLLDKELTHEDLLKIKKGIHLPDGLVKIDTIDFIGKKRHNQVKIVLHSGKYRVVRRLFEKLGYDVIKLDRVRFASVSKRSIPRGSWRYLTEREVEKLKQ